MLAAREKRKVTSTPRLAAAMIRKFLADTDDPYAIAEYEKMLDEIETERLADRLGGTIVGMAGTLERTARVVGDLLVFLFRGTHPQSSSGSHILLGRLNQLGKAQGLVVLLVLFVDIFLDRS
mgnify:CR=1 FL=1